MKLLQLCISKNGILYLNDELNCWVFEISNNQILPLKKIGDIQQYIEKGFYEIPGDEISRIVANCFNVFCEFEFRKENTVIEDAQEGMEFKEEYVAWYYKVLFHPVLSWWTNKNEINIINFIKYEDGYPLLCTDNQICFESDEITAFTDIEIDEMKVGELPEDWISNPPKGKVLCYTHENTNDYVYFISHFSESEQLYVPVDEENDYDGFEYIRPVTDAELDLFKIGI